MKTSSFLFCCLFLFLGSGCNTVSKSSQNNIHPHRKTASAQGPIEYWKHLREAQNSPEWPIFKSKLEELIKRAEIVLEKRKKNTSQLLKLSLKEKFDKLTGCSTFHRRNINLRPGCERLYKEVITTSDVVLQLVSERRTIDQELDSLKNRIFQLPSSLENYKGILTSFLSVRVLMKDTGNRLKDIGHTDQKLVVLNFQMLDSRGVQMTAPFVEIIDEDENSDHVVQKGLKLYKNWLWGNKHVALKQKVYEGFIE